MDTEVKLRKIKTKDTYEASFYLLYGAKLEKVTKMRLNINKAKKKGYTNQWTLSLIDVPNWAVDTWRTYNAFGNITNFVDVRKKLKRTIKHELSSNN